MVVDDHPLVRQALKALLEGHPEFKLVAEVSDGEEAVKQAVALVPDVIIMDITLPNMNGLEATRQIKQRCPSINILVLTVHNDNEHILRILEAGAGGYLTKSVFGEEVIVGIRALISGESVLSAQVLQQILRNISMHPASAADLKLQEKLNLRELEILKLAARGMSNKNISQKLNLSLQTVKGYLVSIFSKLGVGSRTEAVILGLRTGILTFKDLE